MPLCACNNSGKHELSVLHVAVDCKSITRLVLLWWGQKRWKSFVLGRDCVAGGPEPPTRATCSFLTFRNICHLSMIVRTILQQSIRGF
jgi:hypothetical protein